MLLSSGPDWESSGYFADTVAPSDGPAPPGPWLRWADILRRAKAGVFSGLDELIRIYEGTNNWVLRGTCAQLLGDAGTRSHLESLVTRIQGVKDPTRVIHFCGSLASAGYLSFVPVILAAYERFRNFNDADILPVLLSDLLEVGAGPICEPGDAGSIEAYHGLVLQKYLELKTVSGNDDVPVYNGEPFGVVPFARSLLEGLREPSFESDHRRKFEASTGIDCRGFYRDGQLQPLAAAAVIEDFLDSPDAAKYEPGVRYFFGHRIPD